MLRIDFYVLSKQTPNDRVLLACRLVEKAYLRGHEVYIETTSSDQARTLDRVLWTFRAGSFVPHAICPIEVEAPPVTIGWRDNPGTHQQLFVAQQHPQRAEESTPNPVLINLSPEIPAYFDRFGRVVEVVNQEEEILQASRQRFRIYRDRGYEPVSHRL